MATLNRDDLVVKGAHARMHELMAEMRELMAAVPQLPRTFTVSLGEVAGEKPVKRTKGKAYSARTAKRLATMQARYGTTNPRLVKAADKLAPVNGATAAHD